MRRAAVAIAVVVCLSGCSSGGHGSTGAQTAPPSSTLPTSGTVTFTDGRIYTVAPLGKVLRLDDISVRVARVVWRQSITTAFKPPGTKIYGLVTLTIANLSKAAQEVGPTQIWLRDAAGNPHLAAAGAQIPQNLLKIRIAPGKSVSGTLVFPAPRRETGYLLVYRFADASAIAKAKHVGLLRYG